MKKISIVLILLVLFNCNNEYNRPINITSINIESIVIDSMMSVRAIDFNDEYIFYGSADHIGKKALQNEFKIDLTEVVISDQKVNYRYALKNDSVPLHFRAIEEVKGKLFALSVANPARLYKLNRKSNKPKLVYEEIHENVFYDSMAFWNDLEGIAIGDPTDDCMSVIITRDGGETWNKISCDTLPKAKEGEAAFAASDTNIAIIGDDTWVATGGKTSRILHSPDKGLTWEVYETPIIQGKETTGMYSIDFYDAHKGFAIGGDYTNPDANISNKIKTKDGGKTWEVVGDEKSPGYRSCVQYIPGRNAKELVAVGFKGIDYSNDAGNTWNHLSDEGFYTIRFLNDSIAYAAGRGRISKLTFK